MNILIYEGDNNKELRKIYDFILEIPKKKKGEVKVNVNVKIDVNSILTLEIEKNFSSEQIKHKKKIIEDVALINPGLYDFIYSSDEEINVDY